MNMIRKPKQSDLKQSRTAYALRTTVNETAKIGSTLAGGAADIVIMVVLSPFLLFGLYHGPFIMLGGNVTRGLFAFGLGLAALYLLLARRKRKKEASRNTQLGGFTPQGETPVNMAAPNQFRFARQALMSKFIMDGFACFVCAGLSLGKFGLMAVLAMLFAFRCLVFLVNIFSPSLGLKFTPSGIETTDLIGFKINMNWQQITTVQHSSGHILKQFFFEPVLSLRYGSRDFVELTGIGATGAALTMRIPYKMFSLNFEDISTLLEKAQNGEMEITQSLFKAPSLGETFGNARPSAQLVRSELPALQDLRQAGFGRKGLRP